jgi:hypothetical protein
MKRFQLGKDCGREQRQTIHAILEPVGIVHCYRRAGIMPHNMPLSDAVFDSDFFDLTGELFQLTDTATLFTTTSGSSSEARQIDGHAGEAPQQLVDDPAPKLTTGWYAMDEQDRIT